jgi:hypothetical protein
MKRDKKKTSDAADVIVDQPAGVRNIDVNHIPPEFNGPKGPEPTRYGDWEQKGRCTDF